MSPREKGVPVAIMKTAWSPMTTPTAMTIFQWLYVSSGLAPILEKRSEPLQKRIAIRERRNQFIFCCHPFLFNPLGRMPSGGGLRGNRVLCQHWIRLMGRRFKAKATSFLGAGAFRSKTAGGYYI